MPVSIALVRKVRTIAYHEIGYDKKNIMPDWWIRFDTLTCNNAQESRDEPYIVINGRRVWGARRVRTGQTLNVNVRLELDRSEAAEIELWERDEHGKNDDRIGGITVRYRDIRVWEESHSRPNAVFARSGRHFYGDARYTLYFSLAYR